MWFAFNILSTISSTYVRADSVGKEQWSTSSPVGVKMESRNAVPMGVLN